ncbi:MAG: tRNA (adenosine(37)-N6)-threonylcarbamoyltransferase complex transferase subunit TsaD [Actinomycetaceae bacterium]|nr:tRNA (adenosine(37)-N6)-threonylcarbamoyltransferase complex transferase subunit TsaD [Actinomycetaceae bacterium]
MDVALILGVESSCDETGIALVRDGELLVDVTATSMEKYAEFGGIIPEIASRAHVDYFLPTLEEVLEKTEVTLDDVDAFAVTSGPGLVGSLTVGVCGVKALAYAMKKPIYGINHILGHIAVDGLVHGEFPEKFVGLVVSGGHSSLLYIEDIAGSVKELGGTLDDAPGEAFDKIGRLLNLPYPGGPHVDALASQGDREEIFFPRGLMSGKYKHTHPYDFSFSGVKTSVARFLEHAKLTGKQYSPADVAAGFSESVVEALVVKAMRACKDYHVNTLVVGGGFSANSRLRELLDMYADKYNINVRIPPLKLCTDNGAMAAALGWELYRKNIAPSSLELGVKSSLPLSQVCM